MIGTITISDLKIYSTLGVYPEERTKVQEVNLDLMMKVDMAICVRSDNIADAVNYEEVSIVAHELFFQEHYHLIERFAYELMCRLFAKFPLLALKVCVKKKGAIPLAQHASITLEMTKEEFLCLGR